MMRYVALSAFFSKSGHSDVLHYFTFHGDAARPGTAPGHSDSRFLGDKLDTPLQVRKSGVKIHDVFMPSQSLVLSAAVRKTLVGVPNIEYAPIEFAKLVNCWFEVGDFSYYRKKPFLSDPETFRSDRLLDALPDDPGLHPREIGHEELIVPNMYRLRTQTKTKTAKEATVKLPHLTVEDVEFEYMPDLLETYPIFWAMNLFFPRTVFDCFEAFIEWDYFTMGEVDL